MASFKNPYENFSTGIKIYYKQYVDPFDTNIQLLTDMVVNEFLEVWDNFNNPNHEGKDSVSHFHFL